MSDRSPKRNDNRARRDSSPKVRRRFTEVPEERKSILPHSRYRDHDRGRHSSKGLKRRPRSRSPVSNKTERPERNKIERRYQETPTREKRKFKEERDRPMEHNEPKKRRQSPFLTSFVHQHRDAIEDVGNGNDLSITARHFDQTEFLLDDRFSALSTNRPLVIEENISVEIERKITGREDFKIPDVLEPIAVLIPKSAYEGRRPLTLRVEFKMKGSSSTTESWYPDTRFAGRNLEKRIIRSGAGDAKMSIPIEAFDDRVVDKGAQKTRRARIDEGEEWNHETGRGPSRYNDALSGRGRNDEDSSIDRLPDFSKRPGKYSYELWKDRPDMIPKGRSYFEHDLRGEVEDDPRSRDSGGQRSRGRGMRGRGGYSQQSLRPDMDVWRHDKFEEIEAGNTAC